MKTNKLAVATSAIEDHRAAQDALMELNRALTTAGTICRALVHDATAIGGADLKKAARRLARSVARMKQGPNTALWTDLRLIETSVRSAFDEAYGSKPEDNLTD
jgi:hypothetical protein